MVSNCTTPKAFNLFPKATYRQRCVDPLIAPAPIQRFAGYSLPVLLACFAILITARVSAHGQPAIRVDSGPLTGIQQGDVTAYLGIPYAAPPVGELRWRAPQAPQHWTSPLHADKSGSECPRGADLGVFANAGGKEDCLTLNVFVSKEAAQTNKPLPVFVWLYGGSLLVGSASDYDANRLATEGKAVVVTINYRVGLLGFFAHPEIDKEGHTFGHYGFLDQQFALDWVQRNIKAFGGDPANVTIAGESSGGESVYVHVLSPGSAGKFQYGFAMSGSSLILKYPRFGAAQPLDHAEELGIGFAKAVGCEHDSAKCLRSLPVEKILAQQRPYVIVTPILDGTFLPLDPAVAFKTGKFNHVTLIAGSTRDEARFFVGLGEDGGGAPMLPTDYRKTLAGYFGESLAAEVEKEYPLVQLISPSEAYAAAVTDYFFSCPAVAIDRWIGNAMPVYEYEFNDRTAPAYLNPTTYSQGASHTYELPYLFTGFNGGQGNAVKLNPLQEVLSTQMIHDWAQPRERIEHGTTWSPYDEAQDNVMSLTLPVPRPTSHTFRAVHHCDYWDRSGTY